MSDRLFTPPQFIARLRQRDHDSLAARMRALADEWDSAGEEGSAGRELAKAFARALRDEVDRKTAPQE